jgi:hypothetical protein
MRGRQKYGSFSPTSQAADAPPTRAHPRDLPCRRSRLARPATSAHTIACGWTDLRGSDQAGDLTVHVVVDALQGGAGTSSNINVNEVLANRALELLGERHGALERVSPLDDVNLHQSAVVLTLAGSPAPAVAAASGALPVHQRGQRSSTFARSALGLIGFSTKSWTGSHDGSRSRLEKLPA